VSLSENLSFATDYTRRFFDRAGDLLLLFILTLIPLVNILTLGYLGRVVSDSSASKQPPKLDRYGDMFVDGLKVLAAAIIWAIPIIVIAAIVFAVFFTPVALFAAYPFVGNITDPNAWQNFNWTHWGNMWGQGGNMWGQGGNMWGQGYFASIGDMLLGLIPVAIIIFVLGVILEIFAVTGIVHMFKTGSFGKAFAIGEISHIIPKIGWPRYLGLIVVYIVLSVIVGLFDAIPVLGWLIASFLALLVGICMARTISLMYDSAMGRITPAAPVPPTPPVTPAPAVAPTPTPTPTPPTPPPATIYCNNCGMPNPPNANYCNKCGKEIKH